MSGEERCLLVDASVFITLAEIGQVDLLDAIAGAVIVPSPVVEEITDDPASKWLAAAEQSGWLSTAHGVPRPETYEAAAHLGENEPDDETDVEGDVALLAIALQEERPVVVTDDKPLRKTCRALGIELSGSIGVLVHAVESGDLEATEARGALYAMDEVGARLSASLVRRAERLVEDAAGNSR